MHIKEDITFIDYGKQVIERGLLGSPAKQRTWYDLDAVHGGWKCTNAKTKGRAFFDPALFS